MLTSVIVNQSSGKLDNYVTLLSTLRQRSVFKICKNLFCGLNAQRMISLNSTTKPRCMLCDGEIYEFGVTKNH